MKKDGKSILLSKTLWVNLLALAIMIVNYYHPLYVITPEIQAAILIGINLILRLITGKPIIW